MSGEKKTSLGITVYQARHSAKALRRLIARFGETMTLLNAFNKVNNALPDKERIGLKKERKAGASKKPPKKSTKKSTKESAASSAE